MTSKIDQLRAIAYSIDTLMPGFYFWVGGFSFMIGGTQPDDNPYRYPGIINSFWGMALVMPGGLIFSTYRGSFEK